MDPMPMERACRTCGKSLTRKPGPGRWPHFCSAECRRRAAQVEPATATCSHCDEEFVSSRRAAYCSKRCRDGARAGDPSHLASQRRRARASYAPRSSVAFIVCRYCQQVACVRNRMAIKCSRPECNLLHRALVTAVRRARDGHERERYGYTEATAAAYHRRRALKMGATVEKFLHSEIFERDDWICGICSDLVDRKLKWPDPMSVSLDHVVPLALGGDHSRANTQCSHLSCNVRKGARAASP